MGLEIIKQRTYFKIKEGKIVIKDKDGQEKIYGGFKGKLKNIKYVERHVTFNNVDTLVKVYEVTFVDAADGTEYCWSPQIDSSIYASFINCIASLDNLDSVLYIRPYLSKDKSRTNLYVEANGVKLSWKYSANEMPKIEPVVDNKGKKVLNAQGKQVWDTQDRLEWVRKITLDVTMKLESVLEKTESNNNKTIDIEDTIKEEFF